MGLTRRGRTGILDETARTDTINEFLALCEVLYLNTSRLAERWSSVEMSRNHSPDSGSERVY